MDGSFGLVRRFEGCWRAHLNEAQTSFHTDTCTHVFMLLHLIDWACTLGLIAGVFVLSTEQGECSTRVWRKVRWTFFSGFRVLFVSEGFGRREEIGSQALADHPSRFPCMHVKPREARPCWISTEALNGITRLWTWSI